jgi:signal-transduction protein with cAMP-binding, CBS, and nucleotidyltransferase domain
VRKTAGFGKGFEQVMESVEIFSNTNVRTLLEHSERTPLVPLPVDTHIFDVLLALGKHRNHRVVIVDGDKMVNMITQSAMVRFLRTSLENPVLAAHANRTLHDLGLSADKPVISVPLSARAIDAFQIIHRKVIHDTSSSSLGIICSPSQ